MDFKIQFGSKAITATHSTRTIFLRTVGGMRAKLTYNLSWTKKQEDRLHQVSSFIYAFDDDKADGAKLLMTCISTRAGISQVVRRELPILLDKDGPLIKIVGLHSFGFFEGRAQVRKRDIPREFSVEVLKESLHNADHNDLIWDH